MKSFVLEMQENCYFKSDLVPKMYMDLDENEREQVGDVVMEMQQNCDVELLSEGNERPETTEDELRMLEAYQAEAELEKSTSHGTLETAPLSEEHPAGQLPSQSEKENRHPECSIENNFPASQEGNNQNFNRRNSDTAGISHEQISLQQSFPSGQQSFPGTQQTFHHANHIYPDDYKPYKCTQCGKSFKSRDGFTTPLLKHTGEKPYQCDQCGKHFRCKGVRRHHIQWMHAVEKRYKCTECRQEFAMKQDLIRHIRKHTGKRLSNAMNVGRYLP